MFLILHGSWIPSGSNVGSFYIWAELNNPDQSPDVPSRDFHPFYSDLTTIEQVFLKVQTEDPSVGELYDILASVNIEFVELLLPSVQSSPQPSPELLDHWRWTQPLLHRKFEEVDSAQWWTIEAFQLSLAEALDLLELVEIISYSSHNHISFGNDLTFWLIALDFLQSIVRARAYLPSLHWDEIEVIEPEWVVFPEKSSLTWKWQRILLQMPPAVQFYRKAGSDPVIYSPQMLLRHFLSSVLARRVTSLLLSTSVAEEVMSFPRKGKREPKRFVKEWLSALTFQNEVELEELGKPTADLFKTTLDQVLDQLDTPSLTGPSQVYLHLQTPPPDNPTSDWVLSYWLQSEVDPSLKIPAEEVWRTREGTKHLQDPQETLLTGLSKVMNLFTPIRQSLRSKNPSKCLLSIEEVVTFVDEVVPQLDRLGVKVFIPKESEKKGLVQPSVKVSLEPTGAGILSRESLLAFDWQVAIGDTILSEKELEQLTNSKTRIVFIQGRWVEVNPYKLRRTVNYLTSLQERGPLSLTQALKINALSTVPNQGLGISEVNSPDWFRDLTSDEKQFKVISPPPEFSGELRPYQVRGISWIIFMHELGLNVCLADDMGLGKTIQAIVVILLGKKQALEKFGSKPTEGRKKTRKKTRKSALAQTSFHCLVVCPTTVLTNWSREILRFAPSLSQAIYHGPDRAETLSQTPEVLMTSYDLVRRDLEQLSDIQWNLLIIDESQNIKNPNSGRAKAIKILPADRKIAMTGTPLENRLTELWSMFDFLEKSYLGSLKDFVQSFARPIERFNDREAGQHLLKLTHPFILRRVKTDKNIIKDLPDKIETKDYCQLTKEQVALYKAIVDEQLKAVSTSEGIGRRGVIFATLTKLKQVCNHPATVPGEVKDLDGRSGKLKRLLEIADEIIVEGSCLLIFTQYVEMGKLIQSAIEQEFRTEVLFLHGSTTRKMRDTMVERFQDPASGIQVMILSLKAGGTGLNLTRANHVVHYDRWWNPAVENQATDRAFRIGQVRNVHVHKFICSGTVEDRIDELIEQKLKLAEQFVGSGEDWLTTLSNQEFEDLVTLTPGLGEE